MINKNTTIHDKAVKNEPRNASECNNQPKVIPYDMFGSAQSTARKGVGKIAIGTIAFLGFGAITALSTLRAVAGADSFIAMASASGVFSVAGLGIVAWGGSEVDEGRKGMEIYKELKR